MKITAGTFRSRTNPRRGRPRMISEGAPVPVAVPAAPDTDRARGVTGHHGVSPDIEH
ncbi:hypothetical protein [Streptomyces sp. CBMA29]|uniref:hypothetical protein n=1 Tax=Streptomyces sp. CBMA29 TaxID=1896314 RepID=UPI001661CF6F|nr:hypothetical protein [Streptomyces sp. CBMA29]